MSSLKSLPSLIAACMFWVFATLPVSAATVIVVNLDGLGEGFNDPGAPDMDSTLGGNIGATLGAQRLAAFQFAANVWGGLISSSVTIRVEAAMDPLLCDSSGAILGSAGPIFVYRDFPGAPVAATWYVEAVANAVAGRDLDPAANDISAQFNSVIGTTCPFPNVWYYGLNVNVSPPVGTIDFVTVVLHEIAHGLGFLSLVSPNTGAKLFGFDDAYMRFLENHRTGLRFPVMTNAQRRAAIKNTNNLHWTGAAVIAAGTTLAAGRDPASGHVEMYAPNPVEPGSSVSHFSTRLSPDQLMEPFYTQPPHDMTLDFALLNDLRSISPRRSCKGRTATMVGTRTANRMTGTRAKDIIVALGGDDNINGKDGNDVICAGGGNDTVRGGDGKDKLYGESGKDALRGGRGRDTCSGGPGMDTATQCERTSGVP
ncbi:MAG: hypothetical protein ACREWG_13025 [Gammaproteobacteria bacterium]